MSLKIAILGCGRMGRIRAEAAQLWGATLTHFCDPAIAQLDLPSHFPNARWVRETSDLDFSQIDALFICSPPHLHAEHMHLALDHQSPFLIEKPLGITCKPLESVRTRLEERPLIHAVGYMNRYRKSVELLQEHLAKTPMLGLSAHWVNAAYGVPWWSQKACSGGPLNEQAAHFVDLAQIVGGPIREVQVLSQLAGDSGAIGSASIQFRFNSHYTGQLFYSCLAQEKQIGFRVFTQTGELNLSGWDLQPQFAPCEQDPHRYAIFEKETAIFLDAVINRDGSASRCRFEDAYSTQRVLEAIGRASRSGSIERVDQT